MYIRMHGSLLDHVPHDYCTLETWESTSHCMCTFYDTHTDAWFVYASGLQYIFIDVLWYSTIHHSTRRLLSTMPLGVVIMIL